MKHVIFFDAECSFCQKMVDHLIAMDRTALFYFAPLNGATAQQQFIDKFAALKNENSLVLLENFHNSKQRFWIRSKAIFRILWLLGGRFRLIGWLYLMPIGTDLLYRLVARHRHFADSKPSKVIPFSHAERFLP